MNHVSLIVCASCHKGHHEFKIRLLSRLPIARTLTFALFGLLQSLLLSLNLLGILVGNVVNIHCELAAAAAAMVTLSVVEENSSCDYNYKRRSARLDYK